MHLIEIHYVELAELNMSQRCKILVQHYIYSYLKGSDNIRVKIKVCPGSFFSLHIINIKTC